VRAPDDARALDRVYVIRRGRVRHEVPAPRTAAERRALDRVVAEILSPESRRVGTVPGHEVDEVLLIAAWFRKHPKELERTAALEDARSEVRSA
jgi:excinuclease ABC subunit C